MELIEKITVGSGGAAAIEFLSIASDYTDLYLLGSLRTTGSDDFARIKFNDSDANFTQRVLAGAGSGSGTSFANDPNTYLTTAVPSSFTANTFSNISFYIPNYASANFKSYSTDGVTENNATLARQVINAGLWSNTAAITKITLYLTSNNFAEFSSVSLYGVKSATPAGSPKATGGVISYDVSSNHWVHTFTSSGTFTPSEALTVDYLAVAGGGGGGRSTGNQRAGGGGAGGLLTGSTSVTATGYAITVGGGGAGATSNLTSGANGSNSSAFGLTLIGGGGGSANQSPGSGGSGGGGDNFIAGGAGTSGQGFDGGDGNFASNTPGGGGGGAGQAGIDGPVGTGGNGLQSSITGTATYYAGGGGNAGNNAAGGLGGGGAGGETVAATNGTANTGGGGGGGDDRNAGAGGSGIVIVRYSA